MKELLISVDSCNEVELGSETLSRCKHIPTLTVQPDAFYLA